MMFTGTYERNLDAKGRLTLPASLRKQFDASVCVVKAPDVDALYIFSDDGYEKWVMGLFEKRGGFDPRKREDQMLMRKLNAMATPIDIDSASRVSLSEQLRAKASLEREVTVIGNTDHLEVWDRATWERENEAVSDEDLQDLFFA